MTTYRVIVELSVMSNNQEVVFYAQEPVDGNNLANYIRARPYSFGDPYVVVCRPLSSHDTSINTAYRGDVFEEKTSEGTRALDAAYKLLNHLKVWQRLEGDLDNWQTNAVLAFIANNFYDCMSAGCSKYALSLCRTLIERLNIPANTEIYGEKDTVQAFLKEIKDIPRYDHLLPAGDMFSLPSS